MTTACILALCITGVTVIDGDTLRTPGGDVPNIRLFGIQAPERDDPGGPAATAALRALVAGQTLACEHMHTDRYGRIVARCTREDGVDPACALVAAGLAADWAKFSGGYYRRCER